MRINKFRLSLLVLSLIVILGSCCNESGSSSGQIISDFEVTNYQEYKHYDCYNIIDPICIRNDSTYEKTFTLASQNNDCNELILPSVDFAKNSILIYPIFEGSRAYFTRNVQIDSLNKVVTYTISIDKCFCPGKCETFDYNMVLVPAIGIDYEIEYK